MEGEYIIEHSMKDLSQRLNVTRQRIYQIIDKLPEEDQPKRTEKGRIILDDTVISRICEVGGWAVPNFQDTPLPESNEKNYEEIINVLKHQVEQQDALIEQYTRDHAVLQKQISIKDDQLKNQSETAKQQIKALNENLKGISKIADQAQALQLDAQTKFETTRKELVTTQEKLQRLQAIEENTSETNQDETDKQPTKQGFWRRIFGN